jgi:GrpB-like predicted nucleotidyltransferase (UPF0157 family)
MRATALNDAPIELEPYNTRWPELFALEATSLTKVLKPWLLGAVEHIGSTAVPGMFAKPVIDIMAPVFSLELAEPAIQALPELGYCYFPYKAEVMHWFCKPSPAHRTHHLHLVAAGSVLWLERIAFRDALRRSALLAAEYQSLKQRLASEHAHDRDAYTEGKSPFVQSVLKRVGAGAA